jgi:uncharacterized protein YndB with AHSA1/START domain
VTTVHDEKADVIEREVQVSARPDRVFQWLVDPDRIVRWMGEVATIDPRPGGAFRLAYRSGDVVSGKVLEIVPPERLVVSWGWEAPGDPTPPGASRVEFSLIPAGSGTILRVRHSGLLPEARQGHEEGWDYFLPRLDAALLGD